MKKKEILQDLNRIVVDQGTTKEASLKPETIMQKRLGPTFHRTFSLIRPGLSHILRIADENGACSKELLRTGSPLGPEQINAMMRYAYATKLIDETNRLTSTGQTIFQHDPALENEQTLWILHYHLSTPQTLAPAFWPLVTTTLFRPETEISKNAVRRTITDLYANAPEVKINDKSASDCATALLGSYSDDRSMGALGILTPCSPGVYMVNEPRFPHSNTFAFLLADYWQSCLTNTVSIHLSKITDTLAPVFLAGSSVVKQALGDLQAYNYVRVQQRTFPFQVEKLWRNPDEFLMKVYE